MKNHHQFGRHVAFLFTLASLITFCHIISTNIFFANLKNVPHILDPRDYHPLHLLKPSDYSTLMNLSDFSFRMLSTPCQDSTPTLLVMVYSAPENILQRQQIRRTWGQAIPGVHVLFLLGEDFYRRTEINLDQEQDIYHDLVQGSFKDVYLNLTYKHAALFKYAVYHCPNAKYVLKADDDVFVNLMTLMEHLNEKLPREGAMDYIFCRVRPKPPVFRNPQSKWYLSREEFPSDNFPDMCPGWTLLYSSDVLFKLYRQLQKSEFFWIEDVLITGMIREKLNLSLVSSLDWIISDENLKKIINKDSIKIPPFIYGPPEEGLETNLILWNYTITNIEDQKYRYQKFINR